MSDSCSANDGVNRRTCLGGSQPGSTKTDADSADCDCSFSTSPAKEQLRTTCRRSPVPWQQMDCNCTNPPACSEPSDFAPRSPCSTRCGMVWRAACVSDRLRQSRYMRIDCNSMRREGVGISPFWLAAWHVLQLAAQCLSRLPRNSFKMDIHVCILA